MQVLNPVIDTFQLGQLARDLNRLVERSKDYESIKRPMLKKSKKQKRL
jgi:hypothetical protein